MRFVVLVALFVLSINQTQAQDSTQKDDIVSLNVEKSAGFPGGIPNWTKYLQRSLNATVPVKNGAPAGRYSVRVQFIVDRDGSIADIKPLTDLGYGMEAEVVRIIQKSGKWQPAMQGSRTVKAYHVQPVVFIVDDDKVDVQSDAGKYVLIAGKPNKLTIHAPKLKSDELEVNLTNGTVKLNEDGSFTATIDQPGRTMLTVYNKKKNKLLADYSFEVYKQ